MLEDDRVTNSFIDVSHASSVNRRKPRLTMGLCRDRHESVLHLNKFSSVESSFLSSNRLGRHLFFAAILALTSLHSIQSERYLSISGSNNRCETIAGQTRFRANRGSPVCRSAHPYGEAGRTPS